MVGSIVYYCQEFDPTLLVALGEITEDQAKGTTQTGDAVHQFLDYCATHPNEKLHYHTSNIILIIQRNKSYLS